MYATRKTLIAILTGISLLAAFVTLLVQHDAHAVLPTAQDDSTNDASGRTAFATLAPGAATPITYYATVASIPGAQPDGGLFNLKVACWRGTTPTSAPTAWGIAEIAAFEVGTAGNAVGQRRQFDGTAGGTPTSSIVGAGWDDNDGAFNTLVAIDLESGTAHQGCELRDDNSTTENNQLQVVNTFPLGGPSIFVRWLIIQ